MEFFYCFFDMESSEKAVSSPSVEDEHTIHRYLGFAIQSLITQKKNNLAVAGHPTFKLCQQQLKVLQLLIADSTDQLPNSIVDLSQGRLTHVSSQMIKYGGDLLLEFSKTCGNRFNHDTAEISKSVIDNEELYKCFKDCVLLTINSTDSLLMGVDSNTIEAIYSELSVKIINSRLNETLQAQKEIDLEENGKVVNVSQSLRDTLKTFSIAKGRHAECFNSPFDQY